MSPFLGLTRTRSFRLLHPLFRIYTENQPNRHLVPIRQLHHYIRDLPRIAFRTPFEASQHLEYRTDRGLVVPQQARRILPSAPCPVGPNTSRLQCADGRAVDDHRARDEDQHGEHDEGIRAVKGDSDDPHISATLPVLLDDLQRAVRDGHVLWFPSLHRPHLLRAILRPRSKPGPHPGSPERVQKMSPLRLSEEPPADERGDDDERQRDAETPDELGDAVRQEVSDPDPAPRPEGGAP